jgi:hypothetical protein
MNTVFPHVLFPVLSPTKPDVKGTATVFCAKQRDPVTGITHTKRLKIIDLILLHMGFGLFTTKKCLCRGSWKN